MNILVTGASGLAGSAIVECFKKYGFNVMGIGRKDLNLLNRDETFDYIIRRRPNLIVNAAAKVGGIVANNDHPVEYLAENLRMQNNLIEAAHFADVEKFIFLGSSCIYPRDCEQPIKEEYLLSGPLEPTNSAYAIAKIAGIELINSFRRQYGRKWVSIMPTNLYGPRDNFNLQGSHVLPAFIRRFVEAKQKNAQSETLWGTGTPTREFLHVDDLAEAVVFFHDKYDSGTHLNIGTGREISIMELASIVAKFAGYAGEIRWDPSKPNGTPRKVLDSTLANNLGWSSRISLEDGIESTIKWYEKELAEGRVRL
jgi:GDP-L-fucose synthase